MTIQAVAVSWGVVHAHNGVALAQAEEVRHSLLETSSEEHGHTHEDGEPDERSPGHLHGHNAFDHSHETPSVISGIGIGSPAAFQEWSSDHGSRGLNGPPDQIDRPPKYI